MRAMERRKMGDVIDSDCGGGGSVQTRWAGGSVFPAGGTAGAQAQRQAPAGLRKEHKRLTWLDEVRKRGWGREGPAWQAYGPG